MPDIGDALALAAAGWAILPLRGKIPNTPHGVHDATTDPGTIRAWWACRDGLNIGARVPAPLIVLDIDPQNGGSLTALETAAGEPIPATLTVVSGRGTGGGHHYFYRPAGRVTSTRLPPGIDVKTHTGYCVMPPSLHPATGRPYRWLDPNQPVAMLPAALAGLLRASPPRTTRPGITAADDRAMHGLARVVRQAAPGRRNDALYWAARRAAEQGRSEMAFAVLAAAAQAAGLDPAETRRTIRSARR